MQQAQYAQPRTAMAYFEMFKRDLALLSTSGQASVCRCSGAIVEAFCHAARHCKGAV